MADESLKWIIEKITYCDNKTQVSGFDGGPTDEFWVKVTNTGGTGEAQTQIEIKPSQLHNACQTAVISISASTDEKKYVTVERCNPECNCDAITGFTAITTAEASADGQTGITVANFAMNYGCDPSDVSLVGGGATYRTVGNNILADVGPNDTYEEKTYTYYVTYGGEKCYNITGNTLYFKQEAKENPCADAECPTVNVPGTSVDIGYDGGSKGFTIADGYENCWVLSDIYDKNSNTGWGISWINKYTNGILQFNKNTSEEEKHFEFVFDFTGINDNTTFTCSTEATQEISITQKGTPHVEVCTCETAEIRVTDSDQNIPYAEGQRRFCEFNASCVPDDGFDIKVVTKEGCTTDIVNTTNGIKYGKDPNTTNKYFLYGDINANRNADYRCEWLSICGTEFQIRQKGTGETPTKNCEVIFGATPAIIECEDGNQQLLTIYATRQDCANTQRNVKVKWSITKGDATDPFVTGETAIYENITEYNEEIGTLFADTYTIKLEREQNRDYPKTASTTVTITEEDVCKSPTARVRILLQTVPDRNGSGQEFYIYNIDDLRVYFKSKNSDDIKNITLSSSWDAIDYAGVIAPGAVSSQHCLAGDGKYFILQYASERYPIVYQDVDIDFNGMVDPATDELTYTLYVREVCDSYDTEAGQCNCQHMSANAHYEIKTYNGSDTTPITNRGVNWGDCSALGTYLYFTSELDNIQGQMYCHKSDEGDASRRPDARYDNRINFVMDNLEMNNFYKADRDRDGYDVIMVIRMKPNEL